MDKFYLGGGLSRSVVSTAEGRWIGRASMEVLDSGITVLVYNNTTNHNANNGQLHIRFSNNYGGSWSDEDKDLEGGAVTGFPMNPPGGAPADPEGPGEPWLYVAPNGDLLLHMWLVDFTVSALGTYQSRSTDGGLTWSAPAQVSFGVPAVSDDLIFSTDDHFVYDGVIYACARQYDDAGPTNCKNIFIKSPDNGASWEYVSDISSFTTDTIEVGIEYLGSNNILAVLRDKAQKKTYKSTSSDMGATWTALADITTMVGVSGRHRVYTDAHLKGEANWWTDTNLVMVGFEFTNPASAFGRANCYWTSRDGGSTWTGPNLLDNITNDAGYGDIIYNPNTGKYVVVSYYGSITGADLVQYDFPISW